jgi:hypothetical protein
MPYLGELTIQKAVMRYIYIHTINISTDSVSCDKIVQVTRKVSPEHFPVAQLCRLTAHIISRGPHTFTADPP